MPPQVIRWILYDPTTDESWTMPVNPYEMTSPYAQRTVSNSKVSAVTGRTLTFEGRPTPAEMTFTGKVYSKAQWDELLRWHRKPGHIEIIDHYKRKLIGMMTAFEHTPERAVNLWSVVADTDARVYATYVMSFLCVKLVDAPELP